MPRTTNITLSLPPFSGVVRKLVLVNAAVYLIMALLARGGPGLQAAILWTFGLVPTAVVHGVIRIDAGVSTFGGIWQLVTYLFIHSGFFHVFFNMLTLWMFGAQLEQDWGSKRFREFFLFCGVGAALVTIAISYTRVLGMAPTQLTVGASGAVYGILMAFGILYADQQLFLFPFPVAIKAKYLVAILGFVALAGTLSPDAGGVANFAHLGGLFFGWIYVKYLPRRGVGHTASERYYGLRNAYYRWKRGRAARKFEVYMRKHQDDPQRHYFDEHGNYRGAERPTEPRDDDKPWVN